LENRAFSQTEVEAAVERLKTQGFLNDERFACDWACSRVPTKLWGRERLRQELLARGISSDYIESAIERVYSEYGELDLALHAAQKKWRGMTAKRKGREGEKVARYLQRQGFPFEIIFKVLKMRSERDPDSSAGGLTSE
jgi:regulatory protein